ncbi:MAG TPA: glycosyltransferase [Marmoricola sp.]|nr:glycosyltransferase [Marmoricola sp.]
MQEVHIDPIPLDRLAEMLEPDRAELLREYAERAVDGLRDRTVWHVNATATGGGVAEMLQVLLAYARGADVDNRWLVLDGTPDFFRLTKRIHNLLHGSEGDGGPLGDEERRTYEDVLADNLDSMREQVQPGDVVLLHDPQTAGLAAGLRKSGAHVVWRCHVGRDTPNEQSRQAWRFLKPYVEQAQAHVFTRWEYVPDWIPEDRIWIIPPSLDPLSAKNVELDRGSVEASLRRAGLVDFPPDHGSTTFLRRDGDEGEVRKHRGLIHGDHVVPADVRLIMQVSRWDRLKDMSGVLRGFVDHLDETPDDVHLMLVGPDVSGVTDDPEGAEVLAECKEIWEQQSETARERIHLCTLPMDDVDENAHLVNALQRHASVVVQKSLVEGFGLTVAEPMWKAKAVVASAVGGIQDQIVDGECGLLLPDPTDLDGFAERVLELVNDPERAERLGAAARERVRDLFLVDRHLHQYVDVFTDVIAGQITE